jgi:bifunctional non-homologous end joining protein LigD
VHAFARGLAETMVAEHPERLTLEWHRNERGRRIYLDVNRNAYAQHVVAPYGVRARPGAPVAMPIRWEELDDATLQPDAWRVGGAAQRLHELGDAWSGIGRRARSLSGGAVP